MERQRHDPHPQVYFKPSYFKPSSTAESSLKAYEEVLAAVRDLLTVNGAPNVMPFRWFRETAHAAYLVRQHFHSNLLERLGTPPFLTLIEKKWFAFQLLQALKQCHDAGVCHGDVKIENVMLTSWGWLFLTDLANFKPAELPQARVAEACLRACGRGEQVTLCQHPTSGMLPTKQRGAADR